MVSVRHPRATFKNLIFDDRPRRAYLSYPISSTRGLPDAVDEINGFRKEAHAVGAETGTAVFDPVTIDELALQDAFDRSAGGDADIVLKKSDRWPLGAVDPVAAEPEWPMHIPRSEVSEVLPPAGRGPGRGAGGAGGDIKNQIRSRDYRLIEDVHFLAAYRPFFNTKKSDGVDAEIKHAKEVGKKVMVYHPSKDRQGDSASSPFGSNVVEKAERGEFMGYLKKALTRR